MQDSLKFINAQVTSDDYSVLAEIARQDSELSGAASVNLSATIRRLIRQEAKRRQVDMPVLES